MDPVTTTDELIPSGETSSYRSNPLGLAEFTLSRKDPEYVGRAKDIQRAEKARMQGEHPCQAHPDVKPVMGVIKKTFSDATHEIPALVPQIFAVKPGDGSAREQAASCQKVLGGWANIANEYATKRYRSNLINWGIIPFTVKKELVNDLRPGDYLVLPYVRSAIAEGQANMLSALIHEQGDKTWSEQIGLGLHNLSPEEREILLAGCLINYYNKE